jgi:adenylosuccinate lyase
MPHKRNPVVCERVSGLARVVRGHAQAALENVTLWHERDISHSSAERMIFPDATGLLDFMLAEMAWVMDGLIVFPDRMAEQVRSLGGIAFSQSVLLALVDAGLARDEAYRVVQRAAAAAWDEGASFKDVVTADPDVRRVLEPAALDELFDPRRFLQNLAGVFDKLEKLPVEGA